jgi:hypothetical protein
MANAAVALSALWLAGCATMSADQCRVADWGVVGLRDGQGGAPLSLLDDRTKDCAKAGVQVGSVQYLQGREVGLQAYCQIGNAVRQGLSGHGYEGVCPVAIDGEFRRRWQMGMNVYHARSDLAAQESRRRSLELYLRDAQHDDERFRIRNELRDLDWRMQSARDYLRNAEWALERLR